MSQPTKRLATTTNPSSSSSSSGPPPMKKTKSQAVACSLDPNKNGLHHHNHHHDFTSPDNINNDVVFDPSSMALDEDLKPDDRAVAANLSRKKATPPQPAKKLVIKLNKGLGFFFLLLLFLSIFVFGL